VEPAFAEMMVKRPETRMSEQVNYKVVEGWEQLLKGLAHCNVAGVAVDQEAVSNVSLSAKTW